VISCAKNSHKKSLERSLGEAYATGLAHDVSHSWSPDDITNYFTTFKYDSQEKINEKNLKDVHARMRVARSGYFRPWTCGSAMKPQARLLLAYPV
jgi:HD superfamily phosphohydrolase YqeK